MPTRAERILELIRGELTTRRRELDDPTLRALTFKFFFDGDGQVQGLEVEVKHGKRAVRPRAG